MPWTSKLKTPLLLNDGRAIETLADARAEQLLGWVIDELEAVTTGSLALKWQLASDREVYAALAGCEQKLEGVNNVLDAHRAHV